MLSFGALTAAVFCQRPNRFLLECQLVDEQKIVQAHLADPGRLRELLIPGCRVWLRAVDKPTRKTKWSAVLCASATGHLVSLEAVLANRLVGQALQQKRLAEFAAWDMVRGEYSLAGSRWDFLLAKPDGQQLILEVKSVTLCEDGQGMFPDAITARGTRHVTELVQINTQPNMQAAVLFVAQRSDIQSVVPAQHIDPKFAAAVQRASAAGVQFLARQCVITLAGIKLGRAIPFRDR